MKLLTNNISTLIAMCGLNILSCGAITHKQLAQLEKEFRNCQIDITQWISTLPGTEQTITDKNEQRDQEELNEQLIEAAGTGDLTGAQQAIANGADVNATFFEKFTALWRAAHRDDVFMIKLLIEAGADIHAKDFALKEAFYWGHWKAVACLLQHGADITKLTPEQLERLHNSVLAQKYIVPELHEALNNLDLLAVETLLGIIPMEKFPQKLQEQIWSF